jgi:hypothetical protein
VIAELQALQGHFLQVGVEGEEEMLDPHFSHDSVKQEVHLHLYLSQDFASMIL